MTLSRPLGGSRILIALSGSDSFKPPALPVVVLDYMPVKKADFYYSTHIRL